MRPNLTTASPPPVFIIGGGPVGLSMALGLARQGVRSVLEEAEPYPVQRRPTKT